AKPRRSISRATSSVARRRPGTATRLTAGSCWGIISSSISAGASAHLLQLLQGADGARHRLVGEAGLPVGVGDLADVDVAFGIERQAVRGDELAGLEPGALLAAEPGDQLALAVHDGKARAQVGRLEIDGHAGSQLADDESGFLAAAAVEAARPVQVVPLRLVFAVAVEHLHTVVLAVGNVDPAVVVGGDVVGDV